MTTLGKITFGLVTALYAYTAEAQQDPMFTHYMFNTLMVNPAYAGSRDVLTVTALHRSQWVNFNGAPRVQTITMHMPLKNDHFGVGLSLLNDKIGPSNKTTLSGSFAYRMKLTNKSKLALGLNATANVYQSSLSTLQLDQQSDPSFQTNVNNKIAGNVGFGVYYSRERFYAGLSVPNLMQNHFISTENSAASGERRHYYFIAGALLNLSENVAFRPTTFVKVATAVPLQADFTGCFIFLKKLTLGAMYRTGDAFGGIVGFNITEQLYLGYSYDWSVGLSSSKYNQGSHELVLRYDFFVFGEKQVHSPRYF